jgi:sRNA-binding regulator protein Hfq
MTNKTRMVIVLKDGEEIRGVIEWYDKTALKVHRAGDPNILLLKDNIKYMYKENEESDED